MKNIRHFFAPGRVNLIGEHIDYNGGNVFPTAISLGIYAKVEERTDTLLVLKSEGQKEAISFDINSELIYDKASGWANYVKGVVKYLKAEGYQLKGANISFKSDLPIGAGLSSSACLEVLTGYILLTLIEVEIDLVKLAVLCKKAENEFIDVQCGIMDQFAIAMSQPNKAVLLDCDTLKYDYIPLKIEGYKLLIINTNKPRKLVESKYNERCTECETVLKLVQQTNKEIRNLCEAKIENLQNVKDNTLRRRAEHCIREQQRVLQAKEALIQGDLWAFGRLLNQSHASLQCNYEVTGLELDTIVEEAQKVEGCLGARMTGAGFGGCAIALVEAEAISDFIQAVGNLYTMETGLIATFYEADFSSGIGEIKC